MRAFFDGAPEPTPAALGYRRLLAHYYNLAIPESARVLEVGCGAGGLLACLRTRDVVGIDISSVQIAKARKRVPHGTFFVQAGERLELAGPFDVIILSDTLNYAADVQVLFERLHGVARADTRLLINTHSNLWRPLVALGRALGLSGADARNNWLATSDVRNLLALSDWRPVRTEHRLLCPVRFGGLERLPNRWLAPLLPQLCLTIFFVARPIRRGGSAPAPTVSVVVPARNEAGNIRAVAERTPELGAGTELVFVEGHSMDGTWEEIERVQREFSGRRIKILRQSGNGKGDAVRQGFAAATGELLMILDADLTVPPEELFKFYEALASGRAEFANGCRLVYPMEARAMPFFNLCANKTFGLLFSFLLGQPLKDTLCGTKALSRAHYRGIAADRGYFGDFDPFGDFDLLFGAGKLGLEIADVPVRYGERTYGATNIRRWRHGFLLFRMAFFAARKLKFV